MTMLEQRKDPIINALPHSIITVDEQNVILDANVAAQAFFSAGLSVLKRHRLQELVPFGSPILTLVEQVRERLAPVNEYRVDLGLPRHGMERVVDIHGAPLPEGKGHVVLMLQERTIADKMDRQLTHRGAARSVTALAAMLAHEIKNPLSGIKGAAQLLESSVEAEDRVLTRLIVDETDRIVKLVDRMEVFGDERPVAREAINIHAVLEHVRRLAQTGFARGVRFIEDYDPSLPPVFGNRDQLVQVFLNLIKNASEAFDKQQEYREVVLATAFKPGVRMRVWPHTDRVALPLEVTVRDNGSGIAPDLMPYLFDPFLTTKPTGSGLGLALVAKIVGDHGGVVECDSQPRKTVFRVLLPMAKSGGDKPAGARSAEEKPPATKT